MALKGNLRDFSITQLLNLINLARKTGTLVVEGTNETAQICFRAGKLAYSNFSNQDNSLAGTLHDARVLSSSQYRIISERAGQVADKELGLLLINAGYVTQQEILSSLQNYYITILKQLFTWAEGFFRFENAILASEDKILVRVNLENLIMEGSRQMREWEQLQDEIPNLDMALRFTDRPGVNMRNINLSVEEWRVVSYINPKNSIQQIARTNKMRDLEIRRIIFGLLQAGLVELIRPEGMTPPRIVKPPLPSTDKEEQISLVNRIIGRIRSM